MQDDLYHSCPTGLSPNDRLAVQALYEGDLRELVPNGAALEAADSPGERGRVSCAFSVRLTRYSRGHGSQKERRHE